jgi:hypothetical protein
VVIALAVAIITAVVAGCDGGGSAPAAAQAGRDAPVGADFRPRTQVWTPVFLAVMR